MMRVLRPSNLILLSCLIAPLSRSQVPSAEAEFASGMLARQKGDFDGALSHLQRAVDLDPAMIKAHFALGRTAQDFYAPNSRPHLGPLAIREYKKVLELDPSDADAAMNLAYLLYSRHELDESEGYYRKALVLLGADPEAACAVAAMDAQRSWRDLVQTKNELKVPLQKPLTDSPSCRAVRDRNFARVEEGIALLTRALEIRRNSVDLMAFLSWLYTERAEIQCGNRPAYRVDKNTARKWDRMQKETLKKRDLGHVFPRCPPPPPPMPDN